VGVSKVTPRLRITPRMTLTPGLPSSNTGSAPLPGSMRGLASMVLLLGRI
jgi:hypothetical protein